jgi:pyridoxine/pyridoxamine 5'-phosphate oxidase
MMGEMQDAIDRSLEQANPFTKAMFEELACSADEVISFINTVRLATIATANAVGTPHAAVVIAACHDEHVYFTVHPSSILARNLNERPQVGFTFCLGDRSIMGQGTGVRIGEAESLPDLLASLGSSASSGRFTPPGWEGLIYRIDVHRIFAG